MLRFCFLWCWAFGVAVHVAPGAEPTAARAAGHQWKPTADWYRSDLRTPKLAPRTVEQSELRLNRTDDPRWADLDLDDSDWAVVERTKLPINAGIFWIRARVRTLGANERVPALVSFGGAGPQEIYWDGALIATDGAPGKTKATEVPGQSVRQFELAPKLTAPGVHVLALRMSTFRGERMGDQFAQLLFITVPPEKMRTLDSTLNMLPAMGVGALLTIGLSVLVMWLLADRRLIFGLLAALCLSGALMITVVSLPFVWSYSRQWIYYQSTGRVIMVVVVSSLLVTLLLTLFFPALKRRWLWVPAIVQAALASYFIPLGINVLTPILWRVAFPVALIITGWAVCRRRVGSRLTGLGVIGTWAMFERDPKHFEHSDFLFGFLPVLLGLIATMALRLRAERLQARDTRLTAARLEIELLKKSLQPHFLLNTLTALSQVVEEKPAAAVRLIDDLAASFRSLARLSGEKKVSLEEELALCRAHLRVMSARTELPWSLESEGLDLAAAVPPALFLTLIENGFTHQQLRKGATTFYLRAETLPGGVRYTFLAPGTVRAETERSLGGTGLRYVRARLDESFNGAWQLTNGAVAGGWETVIELKSAGPLSPSS